jgi:poly [ADP-ribose] polymerase
LNFQKKNKKFVFFLIFKGLEESCHVLKDTDTGGIYTAVLGLVDITRGTNSYYKLQLLESDNGRQWFVFRA